MSTHAEAGKRTWRNRAPRYVAELRAGIEQRAGRTRIEANARQRFDRWGDRGRLPLWLRVKLRVQAVVNSLGAGSRS
jgi:hypothetical protein